MATEEGETEEGGQTEDSGDTGDTETETETEGGGEKQEAAGDKPARGQRDARRANRYREANEARLTAERELGELRGRYQALEGQFNEFRQQQERDRQAAQNTNASTEARQRVSSLREQARNFLVQSAQSKDPALAKQLLDKHDALMDEADDLRDEMRDEARWEKRRGELTNQGPNPELMTEQMYFLGKYPWLESNVKAQKMARAHFEDLVASGKRQANRATMEEGVTWAAKMLGLGGRTGPSDRSRQVYAGMGQRDGEHDDGESSGTMSVEEVKNTLAYRKLAQLSYPELEPEQAYAKWAKLQGSPAKNGAGAR